MRSTRKNKLVEDSLWVVHSIVKRYPPQYRKELTAVGYLALCESARAFARKRGRFTTYAYKAVWRAITRRVGEEMEWQGRTAPLDLEVVSSARANEPPTPERFCFRKALTLALTIQEQIALDVLLGGGSYQDVAEELEVSRSRVGQIISRLRKRAEALKSPYEI